MGYDLVWARDERHPDARLHLSVWDLATALDAFVQSGAVVAAQVHERSAGIPLYKFTRLDGTLIQADEIMSGLMRIPNDLDGPAKLLADYLITAAQHGGCHVT